MKNLAVEGHPRLLFVDSGLGGLTVLRAVRQAAPEAEIYFIADDAGFPYGTRDEDELVARLVALVGTAVSAYSPDCIVLACNTASTVALSALRRSCDIPVVGTVPAIKPAAQLTESGLVSVLATPATVNREYTHTLIAEFGGAAQFHLVGAARLAALAEAYASGATVEDDDILMEIAPCFIENSSARTDVIVLGCTHYPLLLDRLDLLAPWPVTWLDPAPAIARRVANVLADQGHVVGVGAKSGRGVIAFTSGQPATAALQSLLQACNLTPVALLSSASAA